jgi:hypothetical protein
MPARSQAQAIWARLGCRGSKMTASQCAEFVPHGKGSMKSLPKKISVHAIRRAAMKK